MSFVSDAKIYREEAALRRQAREARYAKILTLHAEGLTTTEIGERVGMSGDKVREVIKRHANAVLWPGGVPAIQRNSNKEG